MHCPICGKELPDNAKYCSKCGSKLIKDDNVTVQKKSTFIVRRIFFWVAICSSLAIIFAVLLKYRLYIPTATESKLSPDPEIKENIGNTYKPDENAITTDVDTGIEFVNNIILVYFSWNATDKDIDKVVSEINGEIVGQIPAINQFQIKINNSDLDELNDLCYALEKKECIVGAATDKILELKNDVIPNDPFTGTPPLCEAWSSEKPSGSNWWLEAINAPEAWDYNDYFSEVSIGIVDRDFDYNHEDLNLSKISCEKDATVSSEPGLLNSHGTHIAGIIGAIPNNGKGISGLVWNAKLTAFPYATKTIANVVSVRKTESSILDAISIAIGGQKEGKEDEGYACKVINVSAGFADTVSMLPREKLNMNVDSYAENPSLCLLQLLEAGNDFVIVQSAGNGNTLEKTIDVENPADIHVKNKCISVDAKYNGLFCAIDEKNCHTSSKIDASDIIDRIIVVGSAKRLEDGSYQQSEFSNAGDRIDICAPGEKIYSTVANSSYDYKSGTSMAAPVVTGVVGMVWGIDPSLSGAEVKKIVCSKENSLYDVEDNPSERHPLNNRYRLVNAKLTVENAIEIRKEKEENRSLDEDRVANEEERNVEAISFSGKVSEPEDVVVKYFSAIKNGEYNTAASCLNPEIENRVKMIGEFLSGFANIVFSDTYTIDQLFVKGNGAKEIDVIETAVIDMESYGESNCTEATVYVKFRYKCNDDYYIAESEVPVKKYSGYGWRIVSE